MKPLSVQELYQELDLDYFKSVSVFGALSDEAVAFLLEKGKLLRLEKGEALFNPGDPGENFFVVCRGSIDFYKHHEGRDAWTRKIPCGDQAGFPAMIALHAHLGRAVAAEDTLALEINSHLFAEFHDQYAFDFGLLLMNLARDMARALGRVGDHLVKHSQYE